VSFGELWVDIVCFFNTSIFAKNLSDYMALDYYLCGSFYSFGGKEFDLLKGLFRS
jgi:hypothetical protein